jgi:hypothetical protein
MINILERCSSETIYSRTISCIKVLPNICVLQCPTPAFQRLSLCVSKTLGRTNISNCLMNILILALAIISTAGALQIPSAFASVPNGCTGNLHHSDSGPTGDPYDASGFHHQEPGDTCPGAQ